jgi:hypothetical protein
MTDDLGKQLHDRATRGEALLPQEQAQLKAWYAAQDQAEMAKLDLTAAGKTAATLQAQVDSTLAQLTVVTRQIQETSAENQALRRENAALRHQLAQRVLFQPA